MNNNLIITIGREYGTGGREIGQKLALRLGVPFYDRELITRAAKKTGFDEKLFEQLDKRATNSFLYSLTMFGSVGLNGMSLTDQLYLAQSNIIREMAEDSSCFFIHGSIEDRVKRVQTCGDYVIEGKTPEAALEKMDKQRSTYYNYYTGKVWGKCDHYDLCINAGRLGVEYSSDIILEYINRLKK